ASSGSYTVTPTTALAEGTYTAQASQSDTAGDTGHGNDDTFTVDTTAPSPTLAHPANGSSTNQTKPTFDGSAGTASGDQSTITVKIYSGNSATGTPVQTLSTTASAGSYTVTPTTALAQGTYTAQASQSDAA